MEPSQEHKHTQARMQIEKYFFQLTNGCGRSDCKNSYCASSGQVEKLTGNQAAIKSLQLYMDKAKLCEVTIPGSSAAPVIKDVEMMEVSEKRWGENTPKIPVDFLSIPKISSSPPNEQMPSNSSLSKKSVDNLSPSSSLPQEPTHLDESKLNEMIDACEVTKNFSPIIRALGLVFSSKDYVIKSFQRQAKSSIDVILDRVQPSAIKTMKKEDLRTLEDDEKEEDSMVDEEQERLSDPAYTSVDLESLRRVMKRLYQKNPQVGFVIKSNYSVIIWLIN